MLSITPEKTYAILIGVSEFEQDKDLLPLPAVENNIDDLERLFTHQTVMGIPSGNLIKIVNAKSESDILDSGLTTKLSNARLETLIIYYAGHGVLGKELELYLATCNTLPSKPKYTGALEAISEQLDATLDDADKRVIKNKMSLLEKEIKETEEELNQF